MLVCTKKIPSKFQNFNSEKNHIQVQITRQNPLGINGAALAVVISSIIHTIYYVVIDQFYKKIEVMFNFHCNLKNT